jgi:hypothetical protein
VVVVGHTHMAKAQEVADQIMAQGGQAVAWQADAAGDLSPQND